MRCPQCEKMVSYGDPEMEVTNEEVDNEGNVTISVRMALTCADCGEELKDNEFELSTEIEHECKPELILCTCDHSKEEHNNQDSSCSHDGCNCTLYQAQEEKEFELELGDPEATDDYRPKTNKQGKPVPMRYQKHFFGVNMAGHITCSQCDEEIQFEINDECQASGFNELV